MAQRRLSHVANRGRSREISGLGDRENAAHLLKVHITIMIHDRCHEKDLFDRLLTGHEHEGMAEVTTPRPPQPSAGSAGTRQFITLTALTALAPISWGTSYLVASTLLPDAPLFAALMRSLPAGLLGLLITRELPRGSWWWRSAILGALNIGAFFPLLFLSAMRLPGGVAAILGATQPLLVVLLAVPLLSERPTLRRISWGLLGVLGVTLIVTGPSTRLDPAGIAAGIGGAACMAMGIVLTRRWGAAAQVRPMSFAAWQLTAGGVLLLPALLIEGVPKGIDGDAVLGYAWLGLIGGLLAYTLWFAGLRSSLPLFSTVLLGLLSPIVATLLGVLIAGETLRAPQLLGLVLAFTATAGSQIAEARRGKAQREDPAKQESR